MTYLKLKILILIKFYWMKNNTKIFLVHDILYKSFIGAKLLYIRFDKVDGFNKVDGSIEFLIGLDI